ncbi:MAG: hypothetical protein LBH40_03020 [Alphaproteobacteria bacterium]|jgi:hypothetical protein|nr:hypothetical protein [Alphaproteobacteria bacterium]
MKIIAVVLLLIGLGGCTIPTKYERDPSKAGYGRDDIKKSRCACNKIYENGRWL